MVQAVSTDERNDAAADRSIELALTAAGMMLEGGASAASVAGAMRDIATAVGLGDVTADVNHSVLTISEHGTAHVGAAAISSRTYDFGRLRDTTRVVNDLCANRIDPSTARRRLDTIAGASNHHTRWLRLVASGGAGASWAVGADPVVTVSAFVVNIVLAWAHGGLTRIGWPLFFAQLIAGIVAVAVAATVAVFHPHTDASLTVTSVIVLLLPGVAFIGGVKDAISGRYLTAIARLAESITAVAGLIIGIQLALTDGRIDSCANAGIAAVELYGGGDGCWPLMFGHVERCLQMGTVGTDDLQRPNIGAVVEQHCGVPAEAAAVEQQAAQVAHNIGGGMRQRLDAVARRFVLICRMSLSH